MSRLDYITILIVIVGIAALSYLIFKIYQNNSQEKSRVNQVETPYDPNQVTDDETADLNSEDYNNSITPQDDDYYDEDGTGLKESTATQEKTSTSGSEEFTTKGSEQSEEPSVAPERDFNNTGASSSYGNYMVIAGTFSLKQNAETQAKRLQQKGYSNASMHIFDRGAYAVVIVDRFDNLADAKKLKNELVNVHKIEAIVQKKK
jgi:cell division septation protein DedD